MHTYICSRGDLPGVIWERTLERRWVAIVRDVCVYVECGEVKDADWEDAGITIVPEGKRRRSLAARQMVSLGQTQSSAWESAWGCSQNTLARVRGRLLGFAVGPASLLTIALSPCHLQ